MRDECSFYLIGETKGWLGASLYAREVLGSEDGAPPPVNLATEKRNGDFVRALIRDELKPNAQRVKAVHDLSDGGVVAAVCEMWLASTESAGDDILSPAIIELRPPAGIPVHAWLFGEDQGRYLLAVDDVYGVERQESAVLEAAARAGVPAQHIGAAYFKNEHWPVPELRIEGTGATIPLARLREANEAWLPAYMGETA
jgi:phosphoribosylformylglycinamidine synthase